MRSRWFLAVAMMLLAGCAFPQGLPQSPHTADIAGTWRGPYGGEGSGTITIVIDTQGNARCWLDRTPDGYSGALTGTGSVTLIRDMKMFRDAMEKHRTKMPEAEIDRLIRTERAFMMRCGNDPASDLYFAVQGDYPSGPPLHPRNAITGIWSYEQRGSHPFSFLNGQFSATPAKQGSNR